MRSRAMAVVLALLAVPLSACVGENRAASAERPIRKGGDNRTGEYTPASGWWKPGPDHIDGWTWGQAAGVVADHPDRILVSFTGDRKADGDAERRPRNYIVAVNRQGEIIENWSQWDTVVAFPHQLYISPYDPERHVWVVERGGGPHDVHEQIIKFTNDGSRIVLRLVDPRPRQGQAEARANRNPGPLDFGQPSTLAFLPNGDFLLGDGYQNGRIIRYDAKGEFVSEFGSVGSGPGQFDLIHGVAVDRNRRILVSDRDNDRIQVFTENGRFLEEWPDILGPTGIHVDEDDNVWVLSTTLNQISRFSHEGELLYQFGAYCCTRGGFEGGFSRPHQMSVDQEGNLYVANYDGGYVTKYVPRSDAIPGRIVGPQFVLPE
jgi:peptidylamidoglycolate lyase